jgi:TolA-binding protein
MPIALAWKALNIDQTPIIKSNFLPSSIIEGQKVFKMAWHGYVILVLLFLSSLYLTKILFEIQFNLEQEKFKNKELYADYTAKKSQAEKMMTMARAIDIQTANIEVIKSLLTGKNAWSEILSKLNNSFQNHPTSWITNLRKSPTGFQITGITTNRPNVVVFSNLFPNGSITKVFNRKIHSFTVWEFEINYSYPDVNWLEMIEADAQQLRKYQETKADKTANNPKQEVQPQNSSQNGKENNVESLSQSVDKTKQSNSNKNSTIKISKATIDIPIPPKSLLVNSDEPDVSLYNDFVIAYNQGQKWLTRDLGLKFINNFPQSSLNSYVRWYLSYRSMQNKEYDKPVTWLAPVLAKSDEVKPYALILLGVTYQNSGDLPRAEEIWKEAISEYPKHQVAKTARKLLNEKQ